MWKPSGSGVVTTAQDLLGVAAAKCDSESSASRSGFFWSVKMEYAFFCLLGYFGLTAFAAVILTQILRGETMAGKKVWYVIFVYWDDHGVSRYEELDAVECECSMDALLFAKKHYRLKSYQSFRAEACLKKTHILRAQLIASESRFQDRCECWTETDWQEFFKIPTYSGDESKYLRTRTR
tara:strand:- start:29 stop:568 length:540 start_codon:yes stop_codon:yes gene_type:complete